MNAEYFGLWKKIRVAQTASCSDIHVSSCKPEIFPEYALRTLPPGWVGGVVITEKFKISSLSLVFASAAPIEREKKFVWYDMADC